MMMDDETLQMYVEEAGEHLEDIESDLLAIEQDGENLDEELVNKVFRAAHSIKGGAGFLGLTTVKELSHKIENVLDMVRNRELVPTPDVVNVILLAFDFLSQLLADVGNSNNADISEHLQALEGLVQANISPAEKQSAEKMVALRHPDGRVAFTVSELGLQQAAKGGKYLYLLEYDLIHDVQQQDKNPLEIIKALQDSGEVVDVKVDYEAVGTLEDGKFANRLPMNVLYASIIEPDLLGTLLELDDRQITPLEEKTGQPAAESAAPEKSEPEKAASTPAAPEEVAAATAASPAAGGTGNAEQFAAPAASAGEPPAAPAAPPAATAGSAKPAAARAEKKNPAATGGSSQSETVRVHVSILDQLMNLAGELVLARNQLLQAINNGDRSERVTAGQRIDLVTSELQEAIMLTRMQPVGNIFNKFPRVIRDMSRNLGKQIELVLEGKEVELDKTIMEGLGDPLTHLVRNSADHGIETPDERLAKGKDPVGRIVLRAYHESGQVNIEISDDGRGLNTEKICAKAIEKGLITAEQAAGMSEVEKANLIMMPGLSTAEKVTEVSGRGVGMDVVKSNLDKLGGQVDIETEPDLGTTIRIKLPLTLAIIPSLLVVVGRDRYAIPQVNVNEMLRIAADKVRERIETVGDAEVLMLRGELIPIIHLARVLGLENTYLDPQTGERRPDRRVRLADARLDQAAADDEPGTPVPAEALPERRHHYTSDVNLVIISSGNFKYALVVDDLHDTEEIVVKPLGRHLKHCQAYAGATIMGDGQVALILDAPGLANLAELASLTGTEQQAGSTAGPEAGKTTKLSLLLFRNAPEEQCAVPLNLVARVEQIKASDIEFKGGKKVLQYRGGSLMLYALEEVANVGMLENREELIVIIFPIAGREVGLLAAPPVDAVELAVTVDDVTLRQNGISGSAIIEGQTTLIIDIFEIMETLNPEWFAERRPAGQEAGDTNGPAAGADKAVLVVEDSDFFRNQVKKFIENDGYQVVAAEDGQVAWDYLREHAGEISLVVTDLEMPNLDGFELTKLIKEDERFNTLPVIALTSLASEENIAKGKAVGIDDYQIKLDKEKLLQSIAGYLH
ncbi:MAG: chemotaxis protein CheW [Deltaproteobacteria bacterium]|nr:chemotaxis protein CheW [Deltaproteobacteria bacterium]